MAQLDWKAEYAYTTGMQAFIYGFPYIYNAQAPPRLGDQQARTRTSSRTPRSTISGMPRG